MQRLARCTLRTATRHYSRAAVARLLPAVQAQAAAAAQMASALPAVGFVGAGQMAEALAKGFKEKGVVKSITVVDLASLLGISAFSLDRWLDKDPEFLREEADDHHHHHHHHDHGHDHGHDHKHHDHKHGEDGHTCTEACSHDHGHEHQHQHKHDDRVSSVGIQMEGNCSMQKLNEWLSKLLQERGPDLFRSKGILSIANTNHKHVFQGVHMLLQFSSSEEGLGRPWAEGEKRVNKLCFIGKNLNREELTASFKACLV